MTPQEVLKQYFGYEEFHPGQEEIIRALLAGRDALAVMPTGAGKSVCYQVSALLMEGITIVISPLISLMQDQVKALNTSGIHSAYINSSLTDSQIYQALHLASEGVYKMIYVAPERLLSGTFLSFAASADISMVTVDEAHCISQWGQDFRPSYLAIIDFINLLSKRPVIGAFTATATEEVKEDIRCSLGLKNPKILVTGFDRPNLFFDVRHESKKDGFVLDYIREHSKESGIIYCATRKNVDSLYDLLEQRDVSVSKYHAGMGNEARKRNQDDFVYDRTAVMVATNAFGMGIDKSNVRYVIHYNMPQSMENYYQEAGRAGRDGEEARCILLFSPQDVIIDRYLLEKKDFTAIPEENILNIQERDRLRLRVMENYCLGTECLRNYILRYFGEKVYEPCGNCANCRRDFVETDMTDAAKWIINCVAEARGRFGVNIITGALVGANRARLQEIGATRWKSYGKLKDQGEKVLRDLIPQMITRGYLIKTDEKYSVLRIGPNMAELRDPSVRMMMKSINPPTPETMAAGKAGKKGAITRNSDYLTNVGNWLYDKLRALRLEIARKQNLPPYIVFTDKTLMDMCVRVPEDKDSMLAVSGVGKARYEQYGEQFLEAIQEFKEAHPGEVISTFVQGTDPVSSKSTREKKKSSRGRTKADFALSPEDAARFEYADYYFGTEIKDKLNEAQASGTQTKKATGQMVTGFLKEEGLILEPVEKNGGFQRRPTEKGEACGIVVLEKTTAAGVPYTLLRYPREVQEMIVEHFTRAE